MEQTESAHRHDRIEKWTEAKMRAKERDTQKGCASDRLGKRLEKMTQTGNKNQVASIKAQGTEDGVKGLQRVLTPRSIHIYIFEDGTATNLTQYITLKYCNDESKVLCPMIPRFQ